jgi:hypothetical protein
MKPILIILLGIFSISGLLSQSVPGQWHEHLPYYRGNHIAEAGDRIYCSTEAGLFYYNKLDNSIAKITKIDGLSDIGIDQIGYNPSTGHLLIAYSNSNIDLIKDNQIFNMPDIRNKIMPGNKSISNILFIHNTAWLACGFGIVVIDLQKLEVKDTYIIGEGGERVSVQDLAFDGVTIFAATEKGIYYADFDNPFLADFSNWNILQNTPNDEGNYTALTLFGDNLVTILKSESQSIADTVFYFDFSSWTALTLSGNNKFISLHVDYDNLVVLNEKGVGFIDLSFNQVKYMFEYPWAYVSLNHAIKDSQGIYWYADNYYGLVRSPQTWDCVSMFPNGPYQSSSAGMDCSGGRLMVAGGGMDPSMSNVYSQSGIYSYRNGLWENLNRKFSDHFPGYVYDIVRIKIDPSDSERFFAGSWGWGLMEFRNNQLVKIYNDSNSTLQTILPGPYCRIGGMTFDKYKNLWMTNAGVNHSVSVMTPEGNWFGFPYGSLVNADQAGDIIVTQNNNKWMILPRGNGLFVFNENNTFNETSDDLMKKLSVRDEEGEVVNDIYSIAEDQDGLIWLGTNQGVLVYYNPGSVFQSTLVANRIIVELDGVPQHLLGTETVTAIAVDGANRKWFGTRSAGVFLMSSDATDQVLQFNTSNSPLLSNNITSISINHESGELFFGTDQGISSYRGTAVAGQSDFTGLYVFPNPVRPEFRGDIVIKGMVTDTNVKITDISGNLVYETNSLGGQAIWDGNDFSGNRVHSGVYLIFCSDEDGSKTEVTKLLFIR